MEKLVILAFTDNGRKLAHKINQLGKTNIPIFVPERICQTENSYPCPSFKENMHYFFKNYTGMICIMATGIVVRGIAGVVEDKRLDPAVVVIDEKGTNVISLLSGHIGGGNQLTRQLADLLHANPVITTATDVQNVTAIDVLAKEIPAWYADFKSTTKRINGLLAEHQPVGILQSELWVTDKRGLIELDDWPTEKELTNVAAVLLISEKNYPKLISEKWVQIVPQCFCLGVGAKRDTPFSVIQTVFQHFCQQHQIHPRSIRKLVSIDIKKEEQGIIQLSESLNIPFETYSKEVLLTVSNKYPQSEFVRKTVGVGNVAVSAADIGSKGRVVTPRFAETGVTMALGKLSGK